MARRVQGADRRRKALLGMLALAAVLLCGDARAQKPAPRAGAIVSTPQREKSGVRERSPQPERPRALPRQLRQFLPEVGPRPAPRRATA